MNNSSTEFENKKILELGICKESIKKWKTIKKAKVYGIGKQSQKSDNVQVFAGNPAIRYDLKHLANQIGKLDLIIDNSSKIDGHALTAFAVLSKNLNGYYFINNSHYMPHVVEVFNKLIRKTNVETYWWTDNEKEFIKNRLITCEIQSKYILIKISNKNIKII
jgi:hypothetical protein